MTARPSLCHLEIPSITAAGVFFPFEMQPIVEADSSHVTAYELLYRGPRPAKWVEVDKAVLRYLSAPRPGLPPVFVNLSNDILMSSSESVFAQAAWANDVTFELSEAVSGYADRAAIAEKVNSLLAFGARIALDDFGAGRDGLERLYSIHSVSAVKIDREFMVTCMRREDARRMLQMLVAQWRRDGITSIAEGVETEALFDFSRSLNVDLVQGWYVDSLVCMNSTDELAEASLPG